MHRELSSTSRLGAASQVVVVATSLAGIAYGVVATWRADWVLLLPGAILVTVSLVTWLTRVRTSVDTDQVTFTQLGKRIRVPLAQVHSCTAHRDRLGLGAGLRWSGRGRWAMLSGDDYVEVSYGDGASLLVSHRSAERLCELLRAASS